MTDNTPSNNQGSGSPLSKQNIAAALLAAAAAPLATAAIQQVSKVPELIAAQRAQRQQPKIRYEAIYRLIYKVRVNGEAALALGSGGSKDERQQIAADSAALRDALHDQLADVRLMSAGRKSDVLDAAQTTTADADHLVAALNKWALNSSDGSQASDLQEVVQALEASENALLSCMGKHRRWRPKKEENERSSEDETRERGQRGTAKQP